MSDEEGSNVTVVKGSQQQRVTKVVLKGVPNVTVVKGS